MYQEKAQSKNVFAKEGFVLVSLGWIVLSFWLYALWLSGEIPHFIDALFEIVSGFTTTGASIVPKVEELSKGYFDVAQLFPLDRRYGDF